MTKSFKVLFVSAEVAPYAKVGGLADVAGALPKALKRLDDDVRIVMPLYGNIDRTKHGIKQQIGTFPVSLNARTEQISIWSTALGETVPVHLIESAHYFNRNAVYGFADDVERFIAFCRYALEVPKRLGWQPDIIHCNDWHTALIPYWISTVYRNDPFYANTATVFTIHNLAYQGVAGDQYFALAQIDRAKYATEHPHSPNTFNMMSMAILYADVINTVSPSYANEILTPEYGAGLDMLLRSRSERLFGILNGIDYEEFNPLTDKRIRSNYDITTLHRKVENKDALQQECRLTIGRDIPLIGIVSRLADQKGFDLIAKVIHWLMLETNIQFVLLGTGEQKYHSLFQEIGAKYPGRVTIFLKFDPDLAQRIYAGSDMFLMPSQFEPCGLGQMISLRYGTIPIVRATGGLIDTIQDFDPRTGRGNGFVFRAYDSHALAIATARALESFKHPNTWQRIIENGMRQDFSWDASAAKYHELYEKAISLKKAASLRA